MARQIKLAVAGAGLAGAAHIKAIRQTSAARLVAVADPAERGRAAAAREGAAWFASTREMIAAANSNGADGANGIDGVVVATPNHLHVAHGLACVDAGIPALIEKPIAARADDARKLVDAARAKNIPLLIGHHRRHNPITARAREIIAGGALGKLTVVNAQCWLVKPDDYFAAEWRRREGAGPVFINLIHDMDLLAHWCGDIVAVRALESNAARGFEVEDTAAVLLKFAGGALGTMSVSDATAAPWSWELTAGENPVYPHTAESCYWIGGTHGALALPNLALWRHPQARSWWAPIEREQLQTGADDLGAETDAGADDLPRSLARQISHFLAVIRGDESPLVTGADGLRALKLIEAVKESAASGGEVALD